MLLAVVVCHAKLVVAEVAPQTTVTKPETVKTTYEEQQKTIKKYLDKLTARKLLIIQLHDRIDFDRSDSKLLEKIKQALPKYYRIGKSTTLPVQALLVPSQSRMFYKYGDYTGNVELPVIEYSDDPKPVTLRTNIANDVLPAYQNEDNSIKVAFRDATMRITNKSNKSLKLDKLALYYNGTFVDNSIDGPIELAPAATSKDISFMAVIERDLELIAKHDNQSAQESQQQKIAFGFGILYLDSQTNASAMLNMVNTYSVYERVRNMPATDLLDRHMASLVEEKKPAPSKLRFELMVEFDSGQATIKKEYLKNLNEVGKALKMYPKLAGVIEGHTDNIGTEDANQKLSERRAVTVKEYLVQTFGIDPIRLRAQGLGPSRPVATNDTPAGRGQNRRIECRLTEPES